MSLKTITFLTLLIFFCSASYNLRKDARCASTSYFATSIVETEIGGSVHCGGVCGFPYPSIGQGSTLKQFTIECNPEQRTRITEFKTFIAELVDSNKTMVIPKFENLEVILTQQKPVHASYLAAVDNFKTEIAKLKSENIKKLDQFFK